MGVIIGTVVVVAVCAAVSAAWSLANHLAPTAKAQKGRSAVDAISADSRAYWAQSEARQQNNYTETARRSVRPHSSR